MGNDMFVKGANFNVKQIADSGQCFRMNLIEKDKYSLIAYDKYLELSQIDDETVKLSCSEDEFKDIWIDYFDLNYDYGKIIQLLSDGEDPFLRKITDFGKGIRILQQEPFEAMISFIISQNKNIPAIKSCIEALCSRYGEPKVSTVENNNTYYAFPTPYALAQAESTDLLQLKTGYRDQYIIRASQAVMEGLIDFNYLKKCDSTEALKVLKSVHGIGDKVANCILLFGLHHIEAFPVDVWIKKVLEEIYHNDFPLEKYDGFAGIVQQYMFYYMRCCPDKSFG